MTRIYFASKVKHAHLWREFRDAGLCVVSSWIDEAGEGQTGDYAELSERCLREIKNADRVVLYSEPGEILKGALIEVGAALMASIPVYAVGDFPSLSRVFKKHPLWFEVPTVEIAVSESE